MSAQSLHSFYLSVFCPLFLRSRSRRTKDLYESTLRSFAKFLERLPTLDDLVDDVVAAYLSWYVALPRSPYSANKQRDNLLAIWRFAARKRYVDRYPDVQAETEPIRVPRAWTTDEIARLFLSIAKEPGWIAGVPASAWWRALHLVAWDCGERIHAIRSLLWEHVDLRSEWIYVPAEIRKGKREDRAYRIARDTRDALEAIRLPSRAEVFPWPWASENYIYAKYRPILQRAGLPSDRKHMFHCLRKSVASHYEAAGGDATKLLGHSARRVTMAYLDPRIATPPQAVDKLFRPGA
jgi:integrase